MSNYQKSLCDMCRESITDRYYLLVGSRKLHNDCLNCRKCSMSLSADASCYEKDEKIYCKGCYFRLFSITKCIGCNMGISSTDLVMQANEAYYHVNCFRCTACSHLLQKGEKFGVRNLKIYCEEHYLDNVCRRRLLSNTGFDLSDHHGFSMQNNGDRSKCYHNDSTKTYRNIPMENTDNIANNMDLKSSMSLIGDLDATISEQLKLPRVPYSSVDTNHRALVCGDLQSEKDMTSLNPLTSSLVLDQLPKIPSIRSSPTISEMTKSLSSSGSSDEDGRDSRTPMDANVGKSKRGKPKRVRTTFKHYQLIAMKELFDIDKNPDSKALTELSEKVDLSKRVLQVWFQNARAKQRKGQSIFSESVEKLLSPASEEKNRTKGSDKIEMKNESDFNNQSGGEPGFTSGFSIKSEQTDIPFTEAKLVFSNS